MHRNWVSFRVVFFPTGLKAPQECFAHKPLNCSEPLVIIMTTKKLKKGHFQLFLSVYSSPHPKIIAEKCLLTMWTKEGSKYLKRKTFLKRMFDVWFRLTGWTLLPLLIEVLVAWCYKLCSAHSWEKAWQTTEGGKVVLRKREKVEPRWHDAEEQRRGEKLG